MIKAIAFDIEGVLVNQIKRKKSIQGKLAKEFNIKNKNWIKLIKPVIKLSSRGKITKKETLIRTKNILKENPKKIMNVLETFYKRSYKINKTMINLSKKLRKNGYKVIIISNLGHLAKEILVENKSMKHFNKKIISCEIKSSKPSEKIFKIALKKSNTKPNEMIFIDNLQKNIEASNNLGIKSILFKNNRELIKELNKLGVKRK